MKETDINRLHDYDFLRCGICGRLCTALEVDRACGPNGTGQACPCGSRKYSPVNLPWWGWLLPRVYALVLARIRALGLSGMMRNYRDGFALYTTEAQRARQ